MKGQNLRIFIKQSDGSYKCVAGSTSCDFHVGIDLEESSDKDSTGGWQKQDVVGKNWSVTVNALYDLEKADTGAMTADDLTKLIIESESPTVHLKWDCTSGAMNRNDKGIGYEGDAIFNDLSATAGNRQNVTATYGFTGNGELLPLQKKN